MEIYLSHKNKRITAKKTDNMKILIPERVIDTNGNLLLKGENLNTLLYLKKNGYRNRVKLIYIDPPFATNTVFSSGERRTATISKSNGDKVAYNDTLIGSAYIEFMKDRLIHLRDLLSDDGSIYLHIDYKIGHYIKILMDEVFGIENFRNDITRVKCNPKNFSRGAYGNIKDMILFYTKTDKYTWNHPTEPYNDEDVNRLFAKSDKSGRRYTTIPLHAPGETNNGPTGKPWRGMLPPKGRHWREAPEKLEELDKKGLIEWSSTGNPRKIVYADDRKLKGKKMQDIWMYKDPQYPKYPTEKNLDLLKLIISASSNEGDIVMDCFCGSGTTLVASNVLGRKWIGIDNSDIAINVSKKRLGEIQTLGL